MRNLTKLAALSVFAFSSLAAPIAYAGFDEAGQNSFWSHQSVASTTPQASANEQYRATYSEPSSVKPATSPEKDPPYFFHAMGTMGTR